MCQSPCRLFQPKVIRGTGNAAEELRDIIKRGLIRFAAEDARDMGNVILKADSVRGDIFIREGAQQNLPASTPCRLHLQSTQIGKATVAFPAIKRLLIHIFAF